MTRTFLMSPTNDLVVGSDGNVAIVADAAAVASDSRAALQTQRGELQFDVTRGVPSFATVWNANRTAQFEAAARVELRRVPGVQSVEALTARREPGALRYTATIRTAFGGVVVNGTL